MLPECLAGQLPDPQTPGKRSCLLRVWGEAKDIVGVFFVFVFWGFLSPLSLSPLSFFFGAF